MRGAAAPRRGVDELAKLGAGLGGGIGEEGWIPVEGAWRFCTAIRSQIPYRGGAGWAEYSRNVPQGRP